MNWYMKIFLIKKLTEPSVPVVDDTFSYLLWLWAHESVELVKSKVCRGVISHQPIQNVPFNLKISFEFTSKASPSLILYRIYFAFLRVNIISWHSYVNHYSNHRVLYAQTKIDRKDWKICMCCYKLETLKTSLTVNYFLNYTLTVRFEYIFKENTDI